VAWYVVGDLGVWSLAPSMLCGVSGVTLGHRARRAAPGSSDAVLAMAGLLLSYGGIVLTLAPMVLIVLAFSSPDTFVGP
jgi:hypothetical protein